MARSGFKMKYSPTKGRLGDFFSSLGKQLRSNRKGIDEIEAEKKSRKAGESKFQADVRRKKEARKALEFSNAFQTISNDAAYYGSAKDKARNSEANRIEPTVTEEPKSKGEYYNTFSGKPGDKFKYRQNPSYRDYENPNRLQESYEFQRPGSDVWETSKTEAGARAIRDLWIDDYEGQNVKQTPIEKKSRGFKMPGYGKRK